MPAVQAEDGPLGQVEVQAGEIDHILTWHKGHEIGLALLEQLIQTRLIIYRQDLPPFAQEPMSRV